MKKQIFTKEEQIKSNRISKSATPKYTRDWYLKWLASALILSAMSIRGLVDLVMYDLWLSFLGVTLWLWVAIIWKDRALIILNGVGLILIMRTLMESLLT